MDLLNMNPKQLSALRKKCLNSFYCFCMGVMGYDDMCEGIHGDYCRFLESDEQRKQVTMPRAFIKTWIGSIAYPIWVTLPRESPDEYPEGVNIKDRFWKLGPNMRILIASYVISNAEKMIGLIRKTYESNTAMQILFPEVIPTNFKKVKWSNQEACINRTEDATESTFEAAGIGGSSTSRHYDLVIEDDLIYANKDDLTGRELQPNQEDIDKAIGWHKIVSSLLVPGKHTRIHNIGTRWAKHDLVNYIWENEKDYAVFQRGCVSLTELKYKNDWRLCAPEWPEAFDHTQLQRIADAQGPYMFATQYLLKPMSPEEMLFKLQWLEFYTSKSEMPTTMRVFTTVDLAGWTDSKRKRTGLSRAVIITCGWCDKNHMWILGYDVGRFNPSEVIEKIHLHYKIYKPETIAVESVYYQESLAHFIRRLTEDNKLPWLPIRQIKPEGNVKKEIRIRALEPIASNHAIHCRKDHKDFIVEFCDYVPNNDTCTKDILDALAYQIQVARPGEPIPEEKHRVPKDVFGTDMDKWLEWAESRADKRDVFGNKTINVNPLDSRDSADILIGSPRFDLDWDPDYLKGTEDEWNTGWS